MNIQGSKHLTLGERIAIADLLVQNKSLNEIADTIDKDARTISKEIKRNRTQTINNRYVLSSKNYPEYCKRSLRFPFVCVACEKKTSCHHKYKFNYDPQYAQKKYELTLRDSRTGLDCSLEEMALMDKTLTDGTKKGQSIQHIVATNPDKIRYSISSVYRLIDQHKTNVSFFDMKLKVKLKPRKKYKPTLDRTSLRKGRDYNAFIEFIAKHPNIPITELDTVESVSEGKHKCLLTIHFTLLHFMLIFILNEKTSENVTKIFIYLQEILGKTLYKKLFRVILTDRGTEFINPNTIEKDYKTGRKITNIFYCNSYASYQKGSIEQNHELIRYVIPKGQIFDNLNQDDINKLVSHINSYYRDSIETTPYILAKKYFGNAFLKKLNITEIPHEQVNLKPDLLI